MQFTDVFLRTLVVAGVLRYLAVAHFGRGRGNFIEGKSPAFWQSEVEQAVAQHDAALADVWKRVRYEKAAGQALDLVLPLVQLIASATLTRLYPGARP